MFIGRGDYSNNIPRLFFMSLGSKLRDLTVIRPVYVVCMYISLSCYLLRLLLLLLLLLLLCWHPLGVPSFGAAAAGSSCTTAALSRGPSRVPSRAPSRGPSRGPSRAPSRAALILAASPMPALRHTTSSVQQAASDAHSASCMQACARLMNPSSASSVSLHMAYHGMCHAGPTCNRAMARPTAVSSRCTLLHWSPTMNLLNDLGGDYL